MSAHAGTLYISTPLRGHSPARLNNFHLGDKHWLPCPKRHHTWSSVVYSFSPWSFLFSNCGRMPATCIYIKNFSTNLKIFCKIIFNFKNFQRFKFQKQKSCQNVKGNRVYFWTLIAKNTTLNRFRAEKTNATGILLSHRISVPNFIEIRVLHKGPFPCECSEWKLGTILDPRNMFRDIQGLRNGVLSDFALVVVCFQANEQLCFEAKNSG